MGTGLVLAPHGYGHPPLSGMLPLHFLLLHSLGGHDRCNVTTCQQFKRYITLEQHRDFLQTLPHSLYLVMFGSDQSVSTPWLMSCCSSSSVSSFRDAFIYWSYEKKDQKRKKKGKKQRFLCVISRLRMLLVSLCSLSNTHSHSGAFIVQCVRHDVALYRPHLDICMYVMGESETMMCMRNKHSYGKHIAS